MIIRNVMTSKIKALSTKAKVREAAQAMKRLRVGALPIVEGEKLVGIITDRDIVVRAIAEGKDVSKDTVEKFMSRNPKTCFDDDEIEAAKKTMEEKQIRRIPVVDHDDKLVGMVSLGDIATEISNQQAGETIEKVSEPTNEASAA